MYTHEVFLQQFQTDVFIAKIDSTIAGHLISGALNIERKLHKLIMSCLSMLRISVKHIVPFPGENTTENFTKLQMDCTII